MVLFTPSVEDFDIVITLKSEFLPRYVHNLRASLDDVHHILEVQRSHFNNTMRYSLTTKKTTTTRKSIKRHQRSALLINFDPASEYLHQLQV
jgi:hypothetical protein